MPNLRVEQQLCCWTHSMGGTMLCSPSLSSWRTQAQQQEPSAVQMLSI
jgi:hypothetical protein